MRNPRRARAVFCLAATLALGASAAAAPDWPQLWGARVTATVDGPTLPGQLTLRELWRRPVGSGFSGIAVSGHRGFTGESDGAIDHAIAIDLETGRTLWRAALGETHRGHDGSRDGPIATPAVGGGRVFMAGPRGLLVAVDATSGREVWRHDLEKGLQARLPFYGFGASPVLVGERVVLHVGGADRSGLVAFDAATGRLAWSTQPAETKGDSTGYTMAAPAELGGEPHLLALGHDRVYALRASDGSLIWSHPLPGPEEPTRPPLVLPGERVLVSRFADSALLKLDRQAGTWKATEVWRSPRLKSSYSPNVHLSGFLFGFGGQYLLCVDAASGEPRWRQKVNAGSLIAVGRHLVVLGEQSGLLRVVEATPDGYRLAAELPVFNAGAQSSTGPSYADGRIYVRNVEEMVALALESDPPRDGR